MRSQVITHTSWISISIKLSLTTTVSLWRRYSIFYTDWVPIPHLVSWHGYNHVIVRSDGKNCFLCPCLKGLREDSPHVGPVNFRPTPLVKHGWKRYVSIWNFLIWQFPGCFIFLLHPTFPTNFLSRRRCIEPTCSIFRPKEKWCIYCRRARRAHSPGGATFALILTERSQFRGCDGAALHPMYFSVQALKVSSLLLGWLV